MEQRKPGNLQRIKNGQRRYAITPRIPSGFVSTELLEKIMNVAKKFGGVLKLTSAQRIMITNLKAEDLEEAWAMLGMEPAYTTANVVRSVRICPGTTFCKRAKQDSVKLGLRIDKKYMSKEMPSRIKFGVSGCPNSCAESVVKDVGIIGTAEGWEVYAGGTAGAHPRLANFIAFYETEDEVMALVDRIMDFYQANAQMERMGEFIDRIGLDAFKEAVLGETAAKEEPAEVPITLGSEGLIFKKVAHTDAPVRKVAEFTLQKGDPITKDSIIRNIIDVYPEAIPVLQGIGMGCLGCPSSTGEPLWQAADIHGVDVNELVSQLEAVRQHA